jgi:hypothetical protein
MKRQKILGIFGEEAFPRIGKGYSVKKRNKALSRLTGCLAEVFPDLVYMVPTKGVCLEYLAIINLLNIPYILVVPNKDFVSIPLPEYKVLIKQSCLDAKNVIVLDTLNPFKGKPNTKEEAIKYVMQVSHKILIAHTEKGENSPHIQKVNSFLHLCEDKEPLNLLF